MGKKALIVEECRFAMRSALYEHTMPGTNRSVMIERIGSRPREMSCEFGNKLAVNDIAIALLHRARTHLKWPHIFLLHWCQRCTVILP